MFTVTIPGGTAPYEVYGGLQACNDYLLAAPGEGAAAYRGLDPTGPERARCLVGATRWIDSLALAGAPTYAGGTTLQVPRSGVTRADGAAMTEAEQIARAVRATFEAAAILAADPDAAAAVDTGNDVRVLDADGAKIEFFAPTSAADGTAPALPLAISRALGPLLGGFGAVVAGTGAAAILGGLATGTSRESAFDDCDAFRRTEPF